MTAHLEYNNVKPFATESSSKKVQVRRMFNNIAKKYDVLNKLLSCSLDRKWRIKAIKELAVTSPERILDIACGTAEMSILATHLFPAVHVVGVDLSEEMLKIGRKKIEKKNLNTRIELIYGDAESLTFGNNSVDGILVAFGIRNFQNLRKGCQEMSRVLKRSKRLVILEFSKPRIGIINFWLRQYLGKVTPVIAKLFQSKGNAYSYLNDSSKNFPDRNVIIKLLQECGFTNTYFKLLTLGICTIYVGEKQN